MQAEYIPSDDEPYMNERQLRYFHDTLVKWRKELVHDIEGTAQHLREGEDDGQDNIDHADYERDMTVEIRSREREQKLVAKIDQALQRIKQHTYGHCEVTGSQIGVARLLARPIATMTKEAQEQHEKEEKIRKERDKYINRIRHH